MQTYNQAGQGTAQGSQPQYGQQQYPQYGQQYPQQQYPQQYPSQYPSGQQQTPQPPQTNTRGKLIAAVIVVGLIFAATMVYILFFAQNDGPVLTPVVSEPASVPTTNMQAETRTASAQVQPAAASEELVIDKMLFASVINDDFSYVEKSTKTYYSIEPVYIYVEAKGFKRIAEGGKYKANLFEDIEVKGPDGEQVLYLTQSRVANISEVFTDYAGISNSFVFGNNSKEGMYSVTITLTDRLTGKKVSKTDSFRMVNLVVEVEIGNVTS